MRHAVIERLQRPALDAFHRQHQSQIGCASGLIFNSHRGPTS
jgi:hypothetical protein